jgi:hypothetical protein
MISVVLVSCVRPVLMARLSCAFLVAGQRSYLDMMALAIAEDVSTLISLTLVQLFQVIERISLSLTECLTEMVH